MPSDVEIWNIAIDRLGMRAIASFSGTDPMSVKARRTYPQCRDLLLRSHPWAFATWKSHWPSISPAANPTMQFPVIREGESVYRIPSDLLRIVKVGDETYRKSVKYQLFDHFLLAYYTGPIPVRYIRRTTNPNKFTPDFIELLALLIAARVSDTVQDADRLQREFIKRMPESQLIDTGENQFNPPHDYTETPGDAITSDTWLEARI